jgi:hypothetical protein
VYDDKKAEKHRKASGNARLQKESAAERVIAWIYFSIDVRSDSGVIVRCEALGGHCE